MRGVRSRRTHGRDDRAGRAGRKRAARPAPPGAWRALATELEMPDAACHVEAGNVKSEIVRVARERRAPTSSCWAAVSDTASRYW